jgi:hypothetical protein
MAFIGSGSPTAPSAVAPISRRGAIRCQGWTSRQQRLRRVRALGSTSRSTGKAQLSALKSLTRWIVGMAGTSTQNSAGPRDIRSRMASSSSWPPRVWFASGKDEVREERADDAGDHDPAHGHGGGGPPELARAGEVAIATAWVTPRTAEAAPAMCVASAAASALALPKMNA